MSTVSKTYKGTAESKSLELFVYVLICCCARVTDEIQKLNGRTSEDQRKFRESIQMWRLARITEETSFHRKHPHHSWNFR